MLKKKTPAIGTRVYLLTTLPDYFLAGVVVVDFVVVEEVVVFLVGVAVVVFLAAVVVVDFAAGLAAVFAAGVEDVCALAPSVIRAAAKTRARLLKLFIVFDF